MIDNLFSDPPKPPAVNGVKVHTTDGWMNPVTGVGGPRDKSAGFAFYGNTESLWKAEQLSALYDEDDMSSRIVDAVVDEALSEGWSCKTQLDPVAQGRVNDDIDRLEVTSKLSECRKWGRLYGLSAMLIGADDGLDVSLPLIEQNIKQVYYLATFEREELTPNKWQDDAMAPHFGEPITYRVQSLTPGRKSSMIVHRSRLILFHGVRSTKRSQMARNGAGASVLLRCLRVLAQFNGMFAQAAAILGDANQNIFKLKGLLEMLLSPDGEAAIKTRVEAMDKARSAVNAILLDADNDEFVRSQIGALTGVSEMLDRASMRLAAAANMPASVLMGQAPQGLNATGEAERAIWDRRCDHERVFELQPPIERIMRCVFAAKAGPTQGVEPEGWSIEWPSLRPPTDKELAEIDNINMQTDTGYITATVLTPQEVRASRYGGDESTKPVAQAQASETALTELGGEDESTDELEINPWATDLAKQMTELGVERCDHGSLNRCRLCEVERVRIPEASADGSIAWRKAWRAIGAKPEAPATEGAPPVGAGTVA